MEPIDPVRRVPSGGWPKALYRLELLPDLIFPAAVYEAACAARSLHRGVVVDWQGAPLIAFPHQSVDEIARTYQRLKAESLDALGFTVEMGTAPTPALLRWIARGLEQGLITPGQASDLAGSAAILLSGAT